MSSLHYVAIYPCSFITHFFCDTAEDMNELHQLGVTEESRSKIEGVHPSFIKEGLLLARAQSWSAFQQIRAQIKEGMTEVQARKLAVSVFADLGCKKHWHQPSIRFGDGTRLTFHKPLRDDYQLRPDDPVYMDLGPVWKESETGIEYEGDVGDSFVFGVNPAADHCIQTARSLFESAKQKWKAEKCTGKALYEQIAFQAQTAGYQFVENVVGHRLGDFPHQKYSKQELPHVSFYPTGYLWILELQIIHPELPIGAFYEDLLF